MPLHYALITGASRGIGRAISLQLANDGYCVILNYLSNKDAAEAVKREVALNGGMAELLQFDVSDCYSVEKAIDLWQEKHSGEYIEVLVNNAGVRDDSVMALLDYNKWKTVLSTSLDGFYHTTSLLLKQMIARRFGRIVSIASISGIIGLPGQTNYSAAKGGIISATKALAKEVATRGITVNAVAPGFIQTDMIKGLDKCSINKTIPMQRMGTPDDVAYVVSFLVSHRASYITGEVISVSGGL